MLLDAFKSISYAIEKHAVDRSIPDVSARTHRETLREVIEKEKTNTSSSSFDHSLWNTVLQRHVSTQRELGSTRNANVLDYNSIKEDGDYQCYLTLLESASPSTLPKTEQLAFWINAYNALCVKLIVASSTVVLSLRSITDLTTLQGPPAVWDQPAGIVAGQTVSLNHIEHEQLRGHWNEPRLHACIVCASASCPNLRPKAFTGDHIDEQLTQQAEEWVRNETKGCNVKSNKVTLSKIFLWFEKDFGGRQGVREFVAQYCASQPAAATVRRAWTVQYFKYDWSINRKAQ